MKINKNDMDNSAICAKLEKQKAKADKLEKVVECLSAQIVAGETSTADHPKGGASMALGTSNTDASTARDADQRVLKGAPSPTTTRSSATGAASTARDADQCVLKGAAPPTATGSSATGDA